MSPREKHIPDDAQRTSVCLTAEDRMAILLLGQSRRRRGSKRTTTNDILVDALWELFEKAEGKGKEHVRQLLPSPANNEQISSNITQMPKPKRRN